MATIRIFPVLIKRALFSCLALLISPTLFATSPGSTYFFPDPGFTEIAPFPASESIKFKELGIKTVQYISGQFITEYQLDSNGLAISAETFQNKKRKRKPLFSSYYFYNQNQQITRVEQEFRRFVLIDSLAYDELGRIIHFRSYGKVMKGKAKQLPEELPYELELVDSDEEKVVLKNGEGENAIFYTLDNENRVRKIKTDFATDSVAFDSTKGGIPRTSYWYWNLTDSLFRLGAETRFNQFGPATEIIYWTGFKHETIASKITNIYDEEGRLIRREPENPWWETEVFLYNDLGLLSEKIINLKTEENKTDSWTSFRMEYFQD